MAGYGTARALAQKLGHDDVATFWADVGEERATARSDRVAESTVNAEAGAAGSDAE